MFSSTPNNFLQCQVEQRLLSLNYCPSLHLLKSLTMIQLNIVPKTSQIQQWCVKSQFKTDGSAKRKQLYSQKMKKYIYEALINSEKKNIYTDENRSFEPTPGYEDAKTDLPKA